MNDFRQKKKIEDSHETIFRMLRGRRVKNALFKIAMKQYLGQLMTFEGEGQAERFTEDSRKVIFRMLWGAEAECFIYDSRKAILRTLDDS